MNEGDVYRGLGEPSRKQPARRRRCSRGQAALLPPTKFTRRSPTFASRPKPDVTGAIQHSIAALEGTARNVTGEPNLTLGRLVSRLALLPPLDTAVEKLWGYASERARHIREGQSVSSEEAELVVSVACAVCTLLSKRSST